jgi:hypothetical protein
MSALAAAVEDAVGVRFQVLPITPDKVFDGLTRKHKAAAKAGAVTEGEA